MKWLRRYLAFGVLAIFGTAYGRPLSVRDDLYQMSLNIQSALRTTQTSDQELLIAREHLQKAYEIIAYGAPGADPVQFQKCVNFAFTQYDRALPTDEAQRKATQICKSVADFSIMEFLFSKHDRELSSTDAMDLAGGQSGASVKGKMPIIEFAFGQYDRELSTSSAATRAATNAKRVRATKLSCLQTAYSRYNQSLSSADAMDRSFEDCVL
jgi:hypothetical protein